jgi:D-alanyl-D-alanine carboxypeptidase (penicillin-binding protein 5/6)
MASPPYASARPSRIGWAVLAAVVALAAIGYVVFALVRSPPAVTVVATRPLARFPGHRRKLDWPRQGQSAVGVQGVGLTGAHGSDRPTPIASVAKVMTAFVVLHDHPLRGGRAGPQIVVTSAAARTFQSDLATGQSVVAVRAGERLSERQALEGLLLPSGNNIATLLATWDAGSQGAFVARMNARARALGLARTRYTGASGVQSSTVSTAADQVRLGMAAMRIPAFAHIVGLAQVNLPVAGRQYNKNALLGQDGIVGIKTGMTSEAGGCFVFAARERLRGRSILVVGGVLHQMGRAAQPALTVSAFAPAKALLASAVRALSQRRVIRRGERIAWMKAPWTGPVALRAARSVSLTGWPGLPIHTAIESGRAVDPPLGPGRRVGTAVISAGGQHATTPLVSAAALPAASTVWRLTHP